MFTLTFLYRSVYIKKLKRIRLLLFLIIPSPTANFCRNVTANDVDFAEVRRACNISDNAGEFYEKTSLGVTA